MEKEREDAMGWSITQEVSRVHYNNFVMMSFSSTCSGRCRVVDRGDRPTVERRAIKHKIATALIFIHESASKRTNSLFLRCSTLDLPTVASLDRLSVTPVVRGNSGITDETTFTSYAIASVRRGKRHHRIHGLRHMYQNSASTKVDST